MTQTMPHSLLISDLHLATDTHDINDCFFRFCEQYARNAEKLYILGDFFNAYVGDDIQNDFSRKIEAQLKKLTDHGVSVYFMHGNRDFFVGKNFLKRTGCIFLKDPSVVDLYGIKTLLLHGDSLCTKDIKHQKFRKKSHNKFYQKCFLWFVPKRKRIAIANKMRMKSMKHQSGIDPSIYDVVQSEVAKLFLEHGVKQMIHGHTHKPAVHELSLQNTNCKRYVLGDWQPNGIVIHADAKGLKMFKPELA